MHTTFLALYRGRTIADATIVAVSAEPELVGRFAAEMLESADEHVTPMADDPALDSLANGRRQALEAIRDEVEP